ncbi:hypothetical protein [Fusobacterium varium]|uniref:hypothetical protein n=1 Tax=Fusobacterium varium TaxID=856 RepID=UPI00241F9ED5|nr:hypothetical protein [Fusobacterium varium]
MEWTEYFKILGTITGLFVGYHKYMLALMEKKVDKTMHDMQFKFLEQQRKEDNKALYENIKEIKAEIGRLSDFLMK